MRTLFADSGHWNALLHPRDQMHERAKPVVAGLESVAIVTTPMALAEALNHLSREGERLRHLAVQMVRGLEDNARRPNCHANGYAVPGRCGKIRFAG